MDLHALSQQVGTGLIIGLINNGKDLACSPGDGLMTVHQFLDHFEGRWFQAVGVL